MANNKDIVVDIYDFDDDEEFSKVIYECDGMESFELCKKEDRWNHFVFKDMDTKIDIRKCSTLLQKLFVDYHDSNAFMFYIDSYAIENGFWNKGDAKAIYDECIALGISNEDIEYCNNSKDPFLTCYGNFLSNFKAPLDFETLFTAKKMLLESNIYEFESGDCFYFNIDLFEKTIYAGSATNLGITHDFEISYNNSLCLVDNIENLVTKILEEHPEFNISDYNERNL